MSFTLAAFSVTAIIYIPGGILLSRRLSKQGKRRTCEWRVLRGTITLAAFIYTFSYLEIVVCCLIPIASEEDQNFAIEWFVLVLTTLLIVIFPIYFMWGLGRNFTESV